MVVFLRFLDEIEKERKVCSVHVIWNKNHVYILITLTRIRSNKKLPDPPPAPPRRLNKNRLFLGSSSLTVSAWASSSVFDDKALSDDTSLSKTQHQTSPLGTLLFFFLRIQKGYNISCDRQCSRATPFKHT